MTKELEVLECLEWISRELKIYYEHLYIVLRDSKEELISNMKKANEYLDTIKQALINYKNITKQIEEADYKSAIVLLVKVKDNLDSYTYNTILDALLKAQEQDKKKATCWDIVFKKNIDMLLIKKYDNVSDYNSAVWLSGREKLTEEEFNTLNEVLE